MEEFFRGFILPYIMLGMAAKLLDDKLYGPALFSFGVFLSILVWTVR